MIPLSKGVGILLKAAYATMSLAHFFLILYIYFLHVSFPTNIRLCRKREDGWHMFLRRIFVFYYVFDLNQKYNGLEIDGAGRVWHWIAH